MIIKYLVAITVAVSCTAQQDQNFVEPPEGYYAFVESPLAIPPKVRPPPYTHIDIDCSESGDKPLASINNICGDLNKGQIPRNPMKQNVFGEPYPFELIRNQTLKFLSKTLPVLKADETLPKVAHIFSDATAAPAPTSPPTKSSREDRQIKFNVIDEGRKSKKFCDGGGVFCTLYRAIQGEPTEVVAERREELGAVKYEGPPTPCPAKVEYATPVFAKNYQGSWRYVVQIPFEGYFTQTVEITRCLQARCHYLDGGCLSSPRWISLLVAEIFYPNLDELTTTTTPSAPSIQNFQAYQTYLKKRAGVLSNSSNENGLDEEKTKKHCDGYDEIGCFQVRLYYDWFLVPGSCKCWRPDYFAKYVRRKSSSDL